MSGSQFVHYEKYNLAEASNILAEALRKEGYCPHVEHPEPPTVIEGDLEELDKYLQDTVPNVKKPYIATKNGKEIKSERKLRKDANVLMCIVASFSRVGAKPGDPDYDQWAGRVLKHFKKRHGDQVKAVVAHFDESHPHLHIYIVPNDFDMSKVCVHDAAVKKVDAECKDRKDLTKKQVSVMKMSAGAQALREWQNDYYEHVGYPSGQARLGPRRRRLTRQQWVDEQAANDLAAACSGKTHAAAVHYKKEAKKLAEQLAQAQQDAAKYKQEAEEAQITVGLMSGLGAAPTKPTLRSDRPAPKPQQPTTSSDFGEFGL